MLRTAVIGFLLSLIVAPPAAAQNQRFELLGTLSGAQAPVVPNPPAYARAPPLFVESDETHNLLFIGFDTRVYWARRLSTVLQVSWGNNPSATFTFEKPSPRPLPFTSYTAEETVERQTWMLSILQSIDLVAEGRFRPWIAGGGAFVRAVDNYTDVDFTFAEPSVRSQTSFEVDRSGSAAVIAGGVKVYLTKSVFLSGDESVRFFVNDRPLGSFNAMWRVGIGISF
jgi:hypothetical protein